MMFHLALSPAWAAGPVDLGAARRAAAVARVAAGEAGQLARADAARAALLAERQVVAAAALRGLEEATGAAAARLADLQGRLAAARGVLAADEAALTRLLPVMERLRAQPALALLAVPGPPVEAVRGVVVVDGIAAGVARRAAAVRAQAVVVAGLAAAAARDQAALTLAVTVQARQEAALDQQIASAKAVEMADLDMAAQKAAAAAAADRRVESLQAMLRRLAVARPALPEIYHGGAPVAGVVFQKFGDGTLAGPAEGASFRTAPGARVVAPCAGSVGFAGPFQGYGLLVILDCGGGFDFVLSGMQRLDVSAGQRLAHGQPVGEMLGYDPRQPTRQPVLYLELRENGVAVDPLPWLGGGSG
jgi:septal ring factor EnvC (AmiA/AmiB activator)